jgi:hypothetical protein
MLKSATVLKRTIRAHTLGDKLFLHTKLFLRIAECDTDHKGVRPLPLVRSWCLMVCLVARISRE